MIIAFLNGRNKFSSKSAEQPPSAFNTASNGRSVEEAQVIWRERLIHASNSDMSGSHQVHPNPSMFMLDPPSQFKITSQTVLLIVMMANVTSWYGD